MITLLAPIAVPVLGAVAQFAFRRWRHAAWIGCLVAVLLTVAAVVVAVEVVQSGPLTGGLLRADALSAFMLVVIGAVALLATAATPAHLRAEGVGGRTALWHGVLVDLFLAAMAAAVLAANLGLVWVAVEATTIVTAFLVGQRRTRAAVEAAWKYVVICSAGIALALLGVILLNFAASRVSAAPGLDIAALTASASELDGGVTRIAVALLILGFGAKAGLTPLHAWLPDAHSQAPAPVSALMSGVLLAVAFYAVLRVKVVADVALGTGFARWLLVAMAVASLVVAASLLLAQRDYKRMLAYSSIEHLGLIAFGAAVGGPVALTAVLLHMLGHGLAKGVLFLAAGRVLQVTGTHRIDSVRGLAARNPVLAGCFGVGVLALIGLPPFSLFVTELGIARAGFTGGMGVVTAVVLVLVLVIAAALLRHTSRMVLGEPPDGEVSRLPIAVGVPLVGGLVVCAALGVTVGPLAELLRLAAMAVNR